MSSRYGRKKRRAHRAEMTKLRADTDSKVRIAQMAARVAISNADAERDRLLELIRSPALEQARWQMSQACQELDSAFAAQIRRVLLAELAKVELQLRSEDLCVGQAVIFRVSIPRIERAFALSMGVDLAGGVDRSVMITRHGPEEFLRVDR